MIEKNKVTSILVFIINTLLLAVSFLIIKNKDSDRILSKKEALLKAGPIDVKILETQSAISQNREEKLRNLNTLAKETKQIDNVTAKTTTTNTATSQKKATTKTKTS